MSSSTLLCHNLVYHFTTSHVPSSSTFALHLCPSVKPKRFNGFVLKAEKNSDNGGHSSGKKKKKKKSWWHRFFFDDDGNWLGLKEDDMVENEEEHKEDGELSEDEKFEAWKQRAEAIIELREAQEDRRNEEYRKWEDWLLDNESYSSSSWSDGLEEEEKEMDYVVKEEKEKGLVESVRSLIFGGVERDSDDDDLLYEDRVFKYASTNSVSGLCILFLFSCHGNRDIGMCFVYIYVCECPMC